MQVGGFRGEGGTIVADRRVFLRVDGNFEELVILLR
jgi:hypothetical protein